MSFNEIKELRHAGKLEDALALANQLLEFDPEDIWNKRAIAWVYYAYLKKFSKPASFTEFKEYLIKLRDLQLPEDERMVFDSSAWQIGKLVFALQKGEQVDFRKINELYEIIKNFHFTKPSESFTFLYRSFHKGHKEWSKYLEFANWWNFDNFRSEDYLKEELNGKKIISIAEQAYIAYSKKLLEGKPIEEFSHQRIIDKEEIQIFLPKLNTLIEKHPDYQYPSYFKAKLLLAVGDEENILSAFLPFARQKRNDFWVWKLMGEIFSEDKDIQFACYCKALSLKTPEDFIVKLRLTFAGFLVDRQLYSEALTEIKKVIATRSKHDWAIPTEIILWMQQDWYQSTTSKKDNKDLYLKHLRNAEEILYQDIPEEIIVVEFVNENKNILNFVKDQRKFGFFNYSGYLDKPQIGDILMVRFSKNVRDNFYKILTAKKAEPHLTSEAVKNFTGKLKIIYPQNFGFIEGVYIPSNLIQQENLSDGQSIKGKAILSFNKRKDEWGWKAIEMELLEKGRGK